MKVIKPLQRLILLLSFLLFFNSCQKEELQLTKAVGQIVEPPVEYTSSTVHGFAPNPNCFVPQSLEGAIVNVINFYETKGNAEPYLFPLIPNFFGTPVWEAYWRFDESDEDGGIVTIVPMVKGDRQYVEGLLIFYEHDETIFNTTAIRRYELNIAQQRTDLDAEDIDGLEAFAEIFVAFDNELFCGSDGSVRCGPGCAPGLFHRIKRWLETKFQLWLMSFGSGGSGGGPGAAFHWVFDFGVIDDGWFYTFIASIGSDGGAGNYGPPPPTIFEQPESLGNLCQLLQSEADGDFYDIDPASINDILAEANNIVQGFCSEYGNIFTCEIFTEEDLAILMDVYNVGGTDILQEISDYLELQGCELSASEKECLISYAQVADELDFGLKAFESGICDWVNQHEIDWNLLFEADVDWNTLTETTLVEVEGEEVVDVAIGILPYSCKSFVLEEVAPNKYTTTISGLVLSFSELQRLFPPKFQTYNFYISLDIEVSASPGEKICQIQNKLALVLNEAVQAVVAEFGLSRQYKLPNTQNAIEEQLEYTIDDLLLAYFPLGNGVYIPAENFLGGNPPISASPFETDDCCE